MKTYPLLDIEAFKFLIASLNLRYFKWQEFLVGSDSVKDGAKNSLPPAELMFNIVPLALLLDEARHRIGLPMSLRSVYRNDEYNAAWGGASGSSHKEFTAADVGVRGAHIRVVEGVFKLLRDKPIVCPVDLEFPSAHPLWNSFRPRGLDIETTGAGTAFVFRGGIKAYESANNPFVHVDSRGWNASW